MTEKYLKFVVHDHPNNTLEVTIMEPKFKNGEEIGSQVAECRNYAVGEKDEFLASLAACGVDGQGYVVMAGW